MVATIRHVVCGSIPTVALPRNYGERGKTMRAVIYRANTKCGQRVSITCDFALGEEDIGENQAISNLIGTCLDRGLEIDLSTYKRQEVK